MKIAYRAMAKLLTKEDFSKSSFSFCHKINMETKPIHVLNKPKSKQRVEILVDYDMDPDGWFLEVKYIEKKSGNVAHKHCIILKDLDNWLSMLSKEGWLNESVISK
jgi:hypothetical protein